MTISIPLPRAPGAPATLRVWVNGREVDDAHPHLSALDRGFTLGDGLFETMRAYDGTLFRLEAHLARLRDGAAALHIPLPGDLAEQVDAAAEATRAMVGAAVVRLSVSRGVGAPGLAPSVVAGPTIVVTAFVAPDREGWREQGITATLARGRRNERSETAGLKTLGYTESVRALVDARAAGADDALFLDTQEHVAEATASNVFLVHGRVLSTPPASCGILPGITRAAVLECARAAGIAVEEGPISLAELQDADEVFLTSSVREVVALVRLDRRDVGSGRPGRLTRALARAYAELVRAECGR